MKSLQCTCKAFHCFYQKSVAGLQLKIWGRQHVTWTASSQLIYYSMVVHVMLQ